MNKKTLKIGIIGGMGPLASASFVETLYTTYQKEEVLKVSYHPPSVYLYSEPLQTQSEALMSVAQSQTEILTKLAKNTANLIQRQIDLILICCFTAHALIPQLLPEHQAKIKSLVTLILEHIITEKTPFMMFCASSAREAEVLERHPLWPMAAHHIVLADKETQTQLNAMITAVKNNLVNTEILNRFLDLMNRFPKYQIVISCAELHILHKKLQEYTCKQFRQVFDPFAQVTQTIWSEIA